MSRSFSLMKVSFPEREEDQKSRFNYTTPQRMAAVEESEEEYNYCEAGTWNEDIVEDD